MQRWHRVCSHVLRQLPSLDEETTMKTRLQQLNMNDLATLYLVIGLVVGLALK